MIRRKTIAMFAFLFIRIGSGIQKDMWAEAQIKKISNAFDELSKLYTWEVEVKKDIKGMLRGRF